MRWIADLCYLLLGMLYFPIVLYNAVVRGKNRHGWSDRFGFIRPFSSTVPRIWIHAVSLGEVNCTPRLVEMLREDLPGHDIVVSTTTDTGFARAVQLFGRENVFRFPLDFSLVVARALSRIQPCLIVLVELEVWYNLVRTAAARGIPVVVVNGRLTARSARRLRKLGSLAMPMFRDLSWVAAQDAEIAERFRALGVSDDRLEVTPSLKWDTALVADGIEGHDALARAMGMPAARRCWVCGSTGPGEEVMILNAYRQLLHDWATLAQGMQGNLAKGGGIGTPTLAIVPRKPERFDEVAVLIGQAGFACVRRRERPDGFKAGAVPQNVVFLGDTMGELRKFYSLADVVFVGRSLVRMGGSDPMEVAALGKPMIVGPHTENFQLPIKALMAADAVRVVESWPDLASAVNVILRDESLGSLLGARAREVVIRNQGATRRTADRIVRLLSASRKQESAGDRGSGPPPPSL